MALPNLLLVREETTREGTTYLVAGRNLKECFENEDGPVTVGTYKLVGKRKLVKTIVPMGRAAQRRRKR